VRGGGGADPLVESDGCSLLRNVKDVPEGPDAHKGKDVVFSEVNLYSMVLTDRYKMAADSLTRETLELHGMVGDPNELSNLVRDPAYKDIRDELTEGPLSYLLSHLDEARLKVLQEIDAARQRRR